MPEQDTTYTPIDCGLHSEYELAIMHKTRSLLQWMDSNNTKQMETVLPIDLIVRNNQEYLKVIASKNITLEIRLDKIIQLQPV